MREPGAKLAAQINTSKAKAIAANQACASPNLSASFAHSGNPQAAARK